MKLLIGLLVSAACWGQSTGQNVVTVLFNSTNCSGFTSTSTSQTITNNTTFTSSAVQNIGQSSHTVIANVTGVTLPYQTVITLNGSSDGTNWIAIGNTRNTSIASTTATSQGFGYQAYPYVRAVVAVSLGSNTSATVSIAYVGTSTPSKNLIEQVNNNNGSSALQTASNSYAVGGSNLLLGSLGGSSTSPIVVYGAILTIPSTLTTLAIGCGSSRIAPAIITIGQSMGDTVMVLPLGLRAWAQCTLPTDDLRMLTTGTGTIGITWVYRYE